MVYHSLARLLLCLEEMALEITHIPVNPICSVIVSRRMLFEKLIQFLEKCLFVSLFLYRIDLLRRLTVSHYLLMLVCF